MNVFRILGDLSHLLAMILLLGKIWRSKSCAGEGRPRRWWGGVRRWAWVGQPMQGWDGGGGEGGGAPEFPFSARASAWRCQKLVFAQLSVQRKFEVFALSKKGWRRKGRWLGLCLRSPPPSLPWHCRCWWEEEGD